jgi:MEMO1 family protein
MVSLERPLLRPLSARRVEHQGLPFVSLQDLTGVVQPVLIPLDGFERVVRHFNGQSKLTDIQAHVLRETGQLLHLSDLEALVKRLDEAMILDGPTFAAFAQTYREAGRRPAAFAGRSYPASPRALRAQLEQFFVSSGGAGNPAPTEAGEEDRLRGILSPHIDFQRGGPIYTWSYKELVERSRADTFVILGVAHQFCRRRFVLTRKDFETPLGLVPTDRSYVDRIAAATGDEFFDDELIHRNEHSIEFQVVFLQYLLGERRNFSIVPILVGSFHDLMQRGIDPINDPDVKKFVDALRISEALSGKKVAYIGGIDLCHIGPEFGDAQPVEPSFQSEIRQFDSAMLGHAAGCDPGAWFREAAQVQNRWRVCGLAATYTMLHTIGPARGRLLKYDQAIDHKKSCCVSFASMAFDAEQPVVVPTESSVITT